MRKKLIILIPVFAIGLLVLLQPVTAVNEDAYKPYLHKANVPEHPKVRLYGSYQTSLFPGAATYTYTIEVPKGTNNLQPYISITYNSQSVKQRPGILGAGWTVTQNYVYRDVNSTPDNTTDDEFKLVLNDASHDLIYDTTDSRYHTKIESFIRIQNLSSAPNTYGTYWIVTTKDGTQYRFGYNSDSELASNTGRSYALRWSLDEVNDTHGNKIVYNYLENPNANDKGTAYLSKIAYNNEQKRNITFVYEPSDRPDFRFVYDQGNELNETRRMIGINVSADNKLVRRYEIEYVNLNTENTTSSLSKIKFIGADNTSVLHQISFSYYPAVTGYIKITPSKFVPPVIFAKNQNDNGGRLVDFNNDGFADIIYGEEQTANQRKAWRNNRSGWTEVTPEWITPIFPVVGGGAPSSHDSGARFVDFDNDGLVDILQANGTVKKAWRNNGTGWEDVSGTWAPPINFLTGHTTDEGVQMVDFNGDGRVDLIQSKFNSTSQWNSSYLNNGNGWTNSSTTWESPTFFLWEEKDSGVRIEDFNGDGLPDIIESSNNVITTGPPIIRRAWLNNGTGWVDANSTWGPPVIFTSDTVPDYGVRFLDVNGDGLTDIISDYQNATTVNRSAWINNGKGWTQNNSYQSPTPFTVDGKNIGRRLADVNGDGFADVFVSFEDNGVNETDTYIRNSSTPFLLRNITTELGGTILVTYQNSTEFNNTGTDAIGEIGFNIFVVSNVTYNNSLSGAFASVFNYSYAFDGGRYDYKDKEFRGFASVNETRPDSSVVVHRFHQTNVLKGKEYNTTVYNSSGYIFSTDSALFNYTNQTGGYFRVFTVAQTNYLHDGAVANPKVTNVSYSYDNFGNVITRDFLGDANVTGDEKYENYSYSINTTAWIVDKLSWYLLFGPDYKTKFKETKYSYDGQVYGKNVTKGDVTAIENWNSNGTNPITRFEYDKFGNVIRTTDPLRRETNYRYGLRDTTFTFVDKITNALDHQTDFKYDLGTGNLLWKKENGIYTYFHYDTFGRLVKEVQPFDSFELPTKNYSYSFDGTAPESIKISQRTTANKTFDTYFYYDGLGNFIQFKKPSDGNQQIVKNLFYDGLGRVSAESNPYFSSFSTGLTTTQNSDFTNYTYDALSRVITVRNPDGNSSRVTFDHWNITAYDENNHRKMYVTDAYGRIVNVLEYNSDPVLKFNFETDTYTTSYQYDTADNLVKITDALGNNFIFVHDSLGRRISLQDPDLGNWTYTYDLVGNLVRQVQIGSGNLVTGDGFYREYNELNQLTIIRNGSSVTSPQLENYTYDPFGQRIKIMRNDTINTTIYTPFKELMRIVNSSGTYDYTYVYDENTLVARVNPDGSKWYYHPDHLGSTSLITDQNGNVVENTFYSPYGELLGGGTSDVLLYTGEFKDATGQYYFGCRYYSPGSGQFIQGDPVFQDVYNPQTLNRFSYTSNDPYNRVDENGCIWNFVIGGVIGFGFSVVTQVGFGLAEGKSFGEAVGDINWKQVGVSTAIGAATSGFGSIATSAVSGGLAKVGAGALTTFGAKAVTNFGIATASNVASNIATDQPATSNLANPMSVGFSLLGAKGATGGTSTASSFGGRLGGTEHRATVGQVGKLLKEQGWEIKAGGGEAEKGIRIYDQLRFPDVWATKNGQTLFVQVGKTTANNQMVSREVGAFADLSKVATTRYVAYDKPISLVGGP